MTDAGWIGHDRQIGTTGVVVDPEVYVAFGVSGAVQHTTGLGTPDHVITVNTDPHCPMMSLGRPRRRGRRAVGRGGAAGPTRPSPANARDGGADDGGTP